MNPTTIACPACQHNYVKRLNDVNNNYFTTVCHLCKTSIHFDSKGQVQAYFMNTVLNGRRYHLAFHVMGMG